MSKNIIDELNNSMKELEGEENAMELLSKQFEMLLTPTGNLVHDGIKSNAFSTVIKSINDSEELLYNELKTKKEELENKNELDEESKEVLEDLVVKLEVMDRFKNIDFLKPYICKYDSLFGYYDHEDMFKYFKKVSHANNITSLSISSMFKLIKKLLPNIRNAYLVVLDVLYEYLKAAVMTKAQYSISNRKERMFFEVFMRRIILSLQSHRFTSTMVDIMEAAGFKFINNDFITLEEFEKNKIKQQFARIKQGGNYDTIRFENDGGRNFDCECAA